MLGFALALGSLLTTGAVAGWLAASSVVVGVYTAREQRKKAERAARKSIQDRNVMVREATADRPHVFGRVRLSGQIQFLGSSGQYNEKMHWALALGDRFDAIEEVWFGDQKLGPLDGNGWATQPPFARSRTEPAFQLLTVAGDATVTLAQLAWSIDAVARAVYDDNGAPYLTQNQANVTPVSETDFYVTADNPTKIRFHTSLVGQQVTVNYKYTASTTFARVKGYLGAPGQAADSYLMSELPGNWSATDRFTGTSYIAGTWLYDPDIYPSGVEDVTAVVRGELCYDPRTSLTVWTRNPALIAATYIRRHYPNETVDDAMLIAAANVCDEPVEYAPSESHERYTFDGVIYSSTAPKQGLEDILQSMVGSAARVAGTWYIWAGAWEEPTMELDESDLAPGEIVIQGTAEDGVLFNGVSGRYLDPEKWVEDSFPTYVSPAYVAEDAGEEEVLDIDLTSITDVYRAQRVRNLLLHKARQALTFACSLELSAYGLHAGRMVTWTMARYGWNEKPFRCLHRRYDPATSTITAVFQEDAEAIYSSDYTELTGVDPAPNTNLPDPRFVAAPILTFASGLQFATILSDGTIRPYLRVYWAAMDESSERVEIWWRRADETTWQQEIVDASNRVYDIYGISAAEKWIVQARAINGVGVRSAWAAYAVDVDPSTPASGGNMTLGVGANLLPNATMMNTASGWQAWLGNQDVPVADFTPPLHTIDGRQFYAGRVYPESTFFGQNHRVAPYNALMLYQASGPAYDGIAATQLFSTNRISVQAGMRLEIQLRAASSNADVHIATIRFYNAAGEYQSDGIPEGETFLTSQESKSGNLSLDSFKRLWGFVNVPPGVVTAEFRCTVGRNVSGATPSYGVVALPYLGYAHPGQGEPTQWSPGPSGGKVEGLDAVTEILKLKVETQNISTTPVLFEQSFTAALDGEVEVSFSASLSATLTSSGGVSKGWCGFTAQLWLGTASGTILDQVSERVIGWESGAIGVTRHGSCAATMTEDVAAGQLYTVRVVANEDTLKFSGMTANDARLRITQVYR